MHGMCGFLVMLECGLFVESAHVIGWMSWCVRNGAKQRLSEDVHINLLRLLLILIINLNFIYLLLNIFKTFIKLSTTT